MTDTQKKEVVAIIPARGGSKGIPRKNIIDLCGKPLIAYSIEVALNAKLIDRVIVSTEDEEISEISKHYGADIPFLRPIELAGDNSSLSDTMRFTLDKLRSTNYRPQIVVYLFPTHPFRTPELLDFFIGKLIDGHSLVRTVCKVRHNSYSTFFMDENGHLVPLLDLGKDHKDTKTYFRVYGTFIGTNELGALKPYNHILENPIEMIDIDTFRDLYFSEMIIKNNLYDFHIHSLHQCKVCSN